MNYFNEIKADEVHDLNLDIDFIKKTTLKNIIKSGTYDILIFDEYVKIFSKMNPLK
jgi:hypothetical protein